jgi:pimeloyl-ACP methyl ester carboxylesterase
VRTAIFARASLVVAAAGVLAACNSRPAATGAAISSPLQARACEIPPASDAQCHVLAVPENRAAPARTIPLHILVLRATGRQPSPDPIFFLAGGPGQAAADVMHDPTVPASDLRRDRDLVYADQRGTGRSHPLNCPFYGPPEQPSTFFDKFLPVDKIRACREELSRAADLSQYTTGASVEDLEAIRVAMGYGQINLVGGSYGTRLAMEYVRRYGQHVRAVILDSPVTPATHAPEGFGRFADAALTSLLDECAATEPCAKAFPDIRQEARAVFDRLRQGPVTARAAHPSRQVQAEVTLTREHVAEAVRYLMYSTQGASRVPLYLHEAFKGNYDPFAAFLMRWRAQGTFDGLYLSITCAEDVPFVAADAAERDDPTFLGGYRVRQQRDACAEWPRGARGERQFEPVIAEVPVLMTSGALDPVTPPANADVLAKTLPRSLHVRIPFSGHSPSGLTDLDCLSTIKRAFIERGRVDGLDTSCVARMTRRGFVTAQ